VTYVTFSLFSPDGRTLHSGGADKLINVWDMEAGRCTATWTGHQSWVWSLQYDPASAVLVSAGQDETIRHWSATTGACLKIQQCDRPYEVNPKTQPQNQEPAGVDSALKQIEVPQRQAQEDEDRKRKAQRQRRRQKQRSRQIEL
jgi:hypothetical protein